MLSMVPWYSDRCTVYTRNSTWSSAPGSLVRCNDPKLQSLAKVLGTITTLINSALQLQIGLFPQILLPLSPIPLTQCWPSFAPSTVNSWQISIERGAGGCCPYGRGGWKLGEKSLFQVIVGLFRRPQTLLGWNVHRRLTIVSGGYKSRRYCFFSFL